MSLKDAKKDFFALRKRNKTHRKKKKRKRISFPMAIVEAPCEAWSRGSHLEPMWRTPLRMTELKTGKNLGP